MKSPIIALFAILSLPQAWALSIEYADWGEFSYRKDVLCSMYVSVDNTEVGIVKKHGNYGLADSTGKVLIPLDYDDGACVNGYAAFLKQGKWGVVDSTRRVLMPFIFDKPIQDFNGVDKVILIDKRDDGTHSAVYDADGQIALNYRHSNLNFENDTLIQFMDNADGQRGFMDTMGNVILKGHYDWVKLLNHTTGDERFLVRANNKTLMLDRQKTVFTQDYDNMEPFDKQGISRVYQNLNGDGKYKVGFVDKNGALIVKPSSHQYPKWNDVFDYEWQLRTDGTHCTLFLEDRLGQAVNDSNFPDKPCKLLTTPNQKTQQTPTKYGLWHKIRAWFSNLIHSTP